MGTESSYIISRLSYFLMTGQFSDSEVGLIRHILDGYKQEHSVKPKRYRLLEFLNYFWDYEKSPYVQDKLLHGQRISRGYCYEQRWTLGYWNNFFTESKMLDELTTDDLYHFEMYLKDVMRKNGNHLANETINNIIKPGRTALRWAARKNLIPYNPADALTCYSVHHKERGVLEGNELTRLFRKAFWPDIRVKAACMLAMSTGMRMGEILALRRRDFDDSYVYVSHSWGAMFGLKGTKNGFSRKVPLHPEVRDVLLELAMNNPFTEGKEDEDSYLFWGRLPTKPVGGKYIREGFYYAMETIGIDKDERKRRNIVFHSWRHFHAAELSGRCGEHSAQVVLGHLSPMMTRHYANHRTEKDLDNVRKAMRPVVSRLCAT
ncbi:MAG: tyrosine-type recombinase/integrase [Treponemataceae bacterium]|nr:tyrosine-type recombinase/integrase [Treponemataceae bacterium]